MTSVGRYITPNAAAGGVDQAAEDDPGDYDPVPDYTQALSSLWNVQLPDRGVNGFGSQFPVFAGAMPSGFTLRLGASSADVFFSGTFAAGGYKIGFIRIPDFAPVNPTTALAAFQREIAFFEANTDGLVVDVTRNPGGSLSYLNQILGQLFFTTWRSIPFEVRATSWLIAQISSALEQVKALGAPPSIVALYQSIKDELITANRANRGRTRPIPLDDVVIDRDPARDAKGSVIGYDKPLVVIVDELTASAGDAFAATIQDNARGLLVGYRTMGAGGNVVSWEAGSYSLGFTTVTQSLMNRKNPVRTNEYPAAPYVENIGVYPDVSADYMTRDNLTQNGKPFVDAFVSAITNYIRTQRNP